ncbi:type III restriction endonuclease subunit R [Roseomonas nepalensis]|uniref:Type III restriction endonuclease subunit R n=1 Tax=Muricoccus nepalensis TaxID=1854500 RepID=A0A502G7H9_9PROT|nr:type III restriction endonuclease subunit R [Roseomonas nepalensis]
MAFAGWELVANHLRAVADAQGPHLNAGQRDSLHALAARIRQHGVVIADEVGMGKTRIAVALARAVTEAGGRVAILIPPTLGFQWREELRHGGIPDVPNVIRSLGGFLQIWSGALEARPWFDEQVLLLSHGFTNWRLGATTQRWRFELLPLIAGHAQHALGGHYPHGFKAMAERADPWVRTAATSIARYCARPGHPEIRRRYTALGDETIWPEANKAVNYQNGGAPRQLLQRAVGLGLGAFDLAIVDEAHKSRGEDAGLSRLLDGTLLAQRAARRVCMTATPVELSASDWDQTLARIQVDQATRAQLRAVIESYSTAARRVRLAWRSSAEARGAYITAAAAFQAALQPYVLRRDKRQDEAVILFREASRADASAAREPIGEGKARNPDAYRWQHDIAVRPAHLDLGWRRAVCAAEALSFVVHGHDDPTAKRLRLTFGNGHGITTRLDASAASAEDAVRQPGDPNAEPGPDAAPQPGVGMAPESAQALGEAKRAERATWWQQVISRVVREEGALYDHPSILAAVAEIEAYDAEREKVLVFGRFTGPMRALVALLNARAMLRAVDAGMPWPQSRVAAEDLAAVAAAHQQLGRVGTFDLEVINGILSKQYAEIERRREALRTSLFDLIARGLPTRERNAQALARAAQDGSDQGRAILAAAIDQLLDSGRRSPAEYIGGSGTNAAHGLSPEVVADAFVSLIAALRERDEGDADGDGELNAEEASSIWAIIAERLEDEYRTERGRFARLMNGATQLSTRRALQLAFNRHESNPRVLVAQSLVGREGLNLHQACRVVILLHPEWNPGAVEQQIGRVDRVGSRWSQVLEEVVRMDTRPLPRIEIRPVIFEGTYDAYHWRVLNERWDDLRSQLHGTVVPYRSREGCTEQELAFARELDGAAPCFDPNLLRLGTADRKGVTS